MRLNPERARTLAIVCQGPRLNRLALARTGDANEGNILVHGVIARALRDERLPSTVQDLDEALTAAIAFAVEQRASAQDRPSAAYALSC